MCGGLSLCIDGDDKVTATCGTCKYGDIMIIDLVQPDAFGGNADSVETPHLVCRRYPPGVLNMDGDISSAWPLVHDEEWCGEWVKKEEEKTEEDEGWCGVDNCPINICGGPHVQHLCTDGKRVITRADVGVCPFCQSEIVG